MDLRPTSGRDSVFGLRSSELCGRLSGRGPQVAPPVRVLDLSSVVTDEGRGITSGRRDVLGRFAVSTASAFLCVPTDVWGGGQVSRWGTSGLAGPRASESICGASMVTRQRFCAGGHGGRREPEMNLVADVRDDRVRRPEIAADARRFPSQCLRGAGCLREGVARRQGRRRNRPGMANPWFRVWRISGRDRC